MTITNDIACASAIVSHDNSSWPASKLDDDDFDLPLCFTDTVHCSEFTPGTLFHAANAVRRPIKAKTNIGELSHTG